MDGLLDPHNPQPLILLLPPLTPQRRLIFALFLLSIPLFLRRMDSSRIMLSRRINSYDLQRHVTNIQELVLRARWHNYYIALFDDLLLSGHDGFASAVCEEQDLVDGMFFVADFSIHGNFHCNKLGVKTRMDDLTEDPKGSRWGEYPREVDHLIRRRIADHAVTSAGFLSRVGSD